MFLEFFAGWIGGCVGILVTFPFDTIKTVQQTFNINVGQIVKGIYKAEGLKGFYQGCLNPILLHGPSNATFFSVYHGFLNFWDSSRIKFEATDIFLAGMVAGSVQTLFTTPLELCKVIMQSQHECIVKKNKCSRQFKNSVDVFKQYYAHDGVRGLYRGYIPVVYRDISTSGIYTLTYEYLKFHPLKQLNAPKEVKELLAGGAAGITSCNTVIPFDVIKSRIQADDPVNPYYKGIWDAAYKIYNEEGWKAFFKGFEMITIRVFIINGVTFVIYQIITNN